MGRYALTGGPSLPGLTRQSILLIKTLFAKKRWMRGSSPRMTERGNAYRRATNHSAQIVSRTLSLRIALSSGMQDPQFVPARKVVPISAMLVARRLAIASCSAFRPTPKQAQMVRPGERAAQGPSGLPARSNVRISGSIFVPKSAATASRDGSPDFPLARNTHASRRLPTTLAKRKVPRLGSV